MKIEAKEDRVEQVVGERLKEMSSKGEYDMSQSSKEYEKIIVKLEAEVRNHISVQQQMKLYIESYQSKLEDLEPLEFQNKNLSSQIDKLNKLSKQMEEEIKILKQSHQEKKEEWNK